MKIERNSLFTARDLSEKEKRNLIMYDLIRRKGVISRAEITKTTGINPVSVSNYINGFIENKMALEKGFDVSTGGRKPELIELNTESNFVVGVEIGKTVIRAVIADIALSIKARKQAVRPSDKETPEAVVQLVEGIIADSKINITFVKAAGVGASDVRFFQAADMIKKKTLIDSYAGTSAACAAFAEKSFNKETSDENILYIHSDVGEGVMMHGGAYLCASEDEKLLDGKLRYLRPWSDYLSIMQSARREVSRGVGTKIVSVAGGKMDNITREVVIAAAKEGDEVALNITQSTGINLGLRIAYLINLFSPEAVIIGGGAEDAGDIIFSPVKKMVQRLSFRNNTRNLKIISSKLGEDATDSGAASLAVREVFLKA